MRDRQIIHWVLGKGRLREFEVVFLKFINRVI